MDNHPIPQDVTHFQFRLIGDMTIKQFAYLAAGSILAWIALLFPVFFLLKAPIALLFAGTGVILAFVPIEGRPADIMIGNFIKALFTPSQYTYQKTAVVPDAAHTTATPITIKTQPKQQETVVLTQTPVMPVAPPLPPAVPEPVVEQAQEEKLSEKVETIQAQLEQAKAEEKSQTHTENKDAVHEKTIELESQLQDVLSQKQQLEQQLQTLTNKLSEKQTQVFTPSTATPAPVTQHVRKVPKQLATSVGAPFVSDVPNLVTGIVKDSRSNILPNILIEVKDKDDNPVRAFKTNTLGQFASATPLQNGVYTMTFEDPKAQQRFDTVELVADGQIMLPLEIISVDQREELRKELFG